MIDDVFYDAGVVIRVLGVARILRVELFQTRFRA